MTRSRTAAALLAAACLSTCVVVARQGSAAASPAEELIRRERIRAAVEEAFGLFAGRSSSGAERNQNLVEAAGRLASIGADAVPYLLTELDQVLPSTFTFCAYALGRMNATAAEPALRRAIAEADEQTGDFAITRKAWSAYALALMGKADAVDLLNQGRHHAAGVPIHFQTTALEAAALLTAPHSLPLLLGQLERYAQDEALAGERFWTLEAIARIPDPASVPALARALGDADDRIRRGAALALGPVGTRKGVEALIQALAEDPEPAVRYAAAHSLSFLLPSDRRAAFIELLETEQVAEVRGVLYRMIARIGGTGARQALIRHWGREQPKDRNLLITALGVPRDGDTLGVFLEAMDDRDAQVRHTAIGALARLRDDEVTGKLLDRFNDTDRAETGVLLDRLVAVRERKAAPLIADRLLGLMANTVTDPKKREQIYKLGDALVSLQHHKVLRGLREASRKQIDGYLVEYLDDLTARLETIKRNGNDRTKWAKTASSDRSSLRLLAYEKLGELGGEASARALAARFGQSDRDDDLEILRHLGGVDAEPARALIERVLSDPEFDHIHQSALREMAGWAARLIGGDQMFEALESSARRRDGRNAKILIYLAQIDGERALPVLESLRLPRLRYLQWSRGAEQQRLEWIDQQVRAGRSIRALDLPPHRIDFRRPM